MRYSFDLRRQSGVSLIEILVVVAIIAVLGAFAFPNMGGWNCSREVRNDFDQINGLLQTLRLEAMSRNASMMARQSNSNNTTLEAWGFDSQPGRQACGSGSWTYLGRAGGVGQDIEINDVVMDRATFRSTVGFPVCFHADGTVSRSGSATPSSATVEINALCDGDMHRYRTNIFGATGFLELSKWKIRTRQWEEM